MTPTIKELVEDAAPSMTKTIVILGSILWAMDQLAEEVDPERDAKRRALIGAAGLLTRIMEDAGIALEQRLEMAQQVQREWDFRSLLEGL